ncbi:hypothetical protein ACFPK9_08130 [Rubritalea spongiae]|uniref:Tyrosine specific protein phosphatases domain-containing protein n=1 Tax=Rubritalea spongiae TaxID=430797 RepID=A0ABW5E1L3_9BACT
MPHLPSISICGVVDFQKIDRSPFTHIISIWHPNPSLPTFQRQMHIGFPDANIHFATFDDTEVQEIGQAPVHNDVLLCLEFARSIPQGSHLLIHCMAGISRSTATAMAVISDFYGPGSELESAVSIQEIRPVANPNRLILEIADEILERNGALPSAADEVFGQSLGQMNKGWGR